MTRAQQHAAAHAAIVGGLTTPAAKPFCVADTEAYDDLCEIYIHGGMEAAEFSRRCRELEQEYEQSRAHNG